MWFMVCRWPQSQEGAWARPQLCKLAWDGLWPVWKRIVKDHVWPHTHTHILFNGPLSGTTRVSRYQKGKTDLDFTEARDSDWQWHQLGHMQVSTSLQTDNHANTPPLSFFTGRMPFLPPNQQCQSSHWRHNGGPYWTLKFLRCWELHCHLPNPNAQVAVSKGIWAVKLCTNEILQFLTGGAG